MRKDGSPKIITTDKLPSYSAVFVRLELLTSDYVEAGPTIDVKINTYHIDGQSE